MLNWDKNVIEYLDRAEEYSKYSTQIISYIRPYISEYNNALEVGCGIGNISIELSKIYKNVTSIDISNDVIKNLNHKIKINNIRNIDAKVLSSSDYINEKYDLIFTSFFYEQDDFIKMIKNNLSKVGVAIFILRKNMQHVVGKTTNNNKNSSYELLESKLANEKMLYEKSKIIFHRDQPFFNDEDIKKFCKLYDNDYNEYKKSVIRLNNDKYEYLYKVKREAYMYIINKG